jgi:hypothetical protein
MTAFVTMADGRKITHKEYVAYAKAKGMGKPQRPKLDTNEDWREGLKDIDSDYYDNKPMNYHG